MNFSFYKKTFKWSENQDCRYFYFLRSHVIYTFVHEEKIEIVSALKYKNYGFNVDFYKKEGYLFKWEVKSVNSRDITVLERDVIFNLEYKNRNLLPTSRRVDVIHKEIMRLEEQVNQSTNLPI